MDIMIGLPISINWKREAYNSILVIVDQLIKMVNYELVKIIIDTVKLAERIKYVFVKYNSWLKLIVSNRSSLFSSKFWL